MSETERERVSERKRERERESERETHSHHVLKKHMYAQQTMAKNKPELHECPDIGPLTA